MRPTLTVYKFSIKACTCDTVHSAVNSYKLSISSPINNQFMIINLLDQRIRHEDDVSKLSCTIEIFFLFL